ILACHRLQLPVIVGFLLTGVIIGPHGLRFIHNVEDVDVLATIGIIFLLFTVGMEFSLKKILEYRRYFLIGGCVQVGLTIALGWVAGIAFGLSLEKSLFIGFLLSLSSTAITLRLLEEQSESDTPHGRLTVGILIFQDIVAIPMMLLTPFLSKTNATLDSNVFFMAFVGIGTLLAVLFAAVKIVPPFLYQITKTRSRELFLLSVLTICFAVAWLTSSLGLSLSLGAFLAGLIISESEYRHQAISDILPFQDVFTSFFFVSIGMLLDISFVIAQPFVIIALSVLVFLLKNVTTNIAALLLKLPLRTALLSGIALCQIGEFSFVLAKNSMNYGLMNEHGYQLFLAVSLLTMGITPTLMAASHSIANSVLQLPLPVRLVTGANHKESEDQEPLKNHILIIGFGLRGQHLALSAKEAEIPYYILEINPQTVKREKEKGEPIHFGDATHTSVLLHAGAKHATAAAVVVNDHIATRHIVERLRRLNSKMYIIARTRYFEQVRAMCELGANDVIPDELGSSLEIFTRILSHFQVPKTQIEQLAHHIRTVTYQKMNDQYTSRMFLHDSKFALPNLEVESFYINSDSPLLNQTLEKLQLRANFGVNVVAIRRGNDVITTIGPYTEIQFKDILTVTGEVQNLKKLAEKIKS
ncbi:MAG: cation:proton antiporter domain-containing protein, partial [Parachlamydiaceae bacterium]